MAMVAEPAKGFVDLPQRLATWIRWHLLSALAIVLVSSHLRLRIPVWGLTRPEALFIGSLALTHGLAAIVVWWRAFQMSGVRLRDAILVVLSAYAALAFALLFFASYYSRSVLLVALFLSVLLMVVPLALARWRYTSVIPASMMFAVGGLFALGFSPGMGEMRVAGVHESILATTFYNVSLVIHDSVAPSEVDGGGLDSIGTGMLVGTGDGRLRYMEHDPSTNTLTSRTLPYLVPVNRAEFVIDTPDDVGAEHFRVADILVRGTGDSIQLLASHHYWKREARCYVVRVSTTDAARESFLAGTAELRWRTAFETQPCLPLKTDTAEAPFSGIEIGGRLVSLDDRTVLLAVGDMAFDGFNSIEKLSQDPAALYGKTIRIDVHTGGWQVYSSGHRNTQGLHVTPDGRIWLTEHGPNGGDELNLVEEGKNYGWPYVTYGAEYGQMTWPLSASQGRHPGYQAALYAWLPAIGVSNLVSVQRDLFDLWHGDFLVASLRAATVFRVRVTDGRVEFAEPMRVGRRIRDITEAPDGRVFLLLDDGSIGVLAPVPETHDATGSPYLTPANVGEVLFGSCLGCHPMGNETARGIGPDLRGVVDRDIASSPGYAYTPPLRRLSGRWTENRLMQFLADPERYAPGTSMRFDGVRDSIDRAALVGYLRRLRKD